MMNLSIVHQKLILYVNYTSIKEINESALQKDTCTPMFTAALFIIAKT